MRAHGLRLILNPNSPSLQDKCVACIILFILISSSEQSSSPHKDCTSSVEGVALTNHAYKAFVSRDMQVCYQRCVSEELCQSINFAKDRNICELNNRTLATNPLSFRNEQGVYYFENPFRGK